ncbi:MAG: hypothetical protein ABII39_05625 [Candidatus Micrarchaeota archaeon]
MSLHVGGIYVKADGVTREQVINAIKPIKYTPYFEESKERIHRFDKLKCGPYENRTPHKE